MHQQQPPPYDGNQYPQQQQPGYPVYNKDFNQPMMPQPGYGQQGPPQMYVPQQQQQMYPQQPQIVVQTVHAPQPGNAGVVIIQERPAVNHCLHCVISLFFFPWIFVWMILCCVHGC